jgi:hypothetical protein
MGGFYRGMAEFRSFNCIDSEVLVNEQGEWND